MTDPGTLLNAVSTALWRLVDDELKGLAAELKSLHALTGETEPALQQRLLDALPTLPKGRALLGLVRDIVGDLPAEGDLRAHGWSTTSGSLGVALVLSRPDGRAVLAFAPGPTIDVVVTAGTNLSVPLTKPNDRWDVTVSITSQSVWNATFTRNDPAPPAALGDATLKVIRKNGPKLDAAGGPGVAAHQITTTLRVAPTQPLSVDIALEQFKAAVLPPALASLLGAAGDTSVGPTGDPVIIHADRASGIRFADGGIQSTLPLRLDLPGVSTRGVAIDLDLDASARNLVFGVTVSALAQLPGLPISALINDIKLPVPIDIGMDRIGVHPQLEAPMPSGIGISLALPPVTGGGVIKKELDGSYRGVIDVDLGVVAVKAVGVLRLEKQLGTTVEPMSFMVLLGLQLPYPGIQLSFGFALDAVGGIVGVNRRIDVERLRGLVGQGNADRILFPGNDVVSRVDEIAGALDDCFPVARGRFVVGPMVRINWGGRIVTVAAAVVLDLPEPARISVIGRVVVALPDPAVPLILLQAGVFGRIDPGIPLVEFLASLNGSWIIGYPLTGELYLLYRGGADAVFVLSAGGFHPRFPRPAGVPQLQRMGMQLGSGILRLRAEAYLALTSNSLQFGGKLQLDATIAGCGVEGNLGLDALFVWEPVLFFSVHVYAGVAVLAFGHRLASVGLDFTLEGPGEWHAFGTGSISVLFLEKSLDFDIRWGSKPAVTPRPTDIVGELTTVFARRESWAVERNESRRVVGLAYTDTALRELADGRVAQADSTWHCDQGVVPLDKPIARFHRVAIPDQTWSFVFDAVSLGPGNSVHVDDKQELTKLFVPGEFFAMNEDEQLGTPAFQKLRSGFAFTDQDLDLRPPRRADDTYQIAYQVDDDWFPTGSTAPRRIRQLGKARHRLEMWGRVMTAAERVDRWGAAQGGLTRPIAVHR